ncbi:MAG: MFS transporter [Clostridia bacterium]|nr:MFS transporter [Clostridia bacterium]
MSKIKAFMTDVRTHWHEPDRSKGNYVPFKEYLDIFLGVSFNYAAQSPLGYISFAAGCYLIMYHYNLPYLAFSIVSLIGIPLSYLWSILSWIVNDNLGFMKKKTEAVMYSIYFASVALGLILLVMDISALFSQDSFIIETLNGLSGINARSFFKIFGVQLLVNGFGGARGIFWRKKLVPVFGRYKYNLYSSVIQKCILIILIGWLPIYNIPDVNERFWIAYLLFSLFTMYDFSTTTEQCTQTISPNPQERLWVRTYPVKISHLLNSVFVLILPLLGEFDDLNFYRWVVPCTFVPCAMLTLYFAKNIKERIPQPPIEKKQNISFWYGIFNVIKNKYHWLNTTTSLIDSLGNGMLSLTTVIYFYTMRLSGLEYSLITLLFTFRGTLPTFIAPMIMKRFSYKTLCIFKQIIEVLSAGINVLVIVFMGNNIVLSGWILYASLWIRGFLVEVMNIAKNDMNIRLQDYQMYLSGERLASFSGVFSWFISPITTLVGLIIPVILLQNGFNSNWDVLFIDDSRVGILVVPLLFDLVGHALMMIPYLFWDYNNPQHLYAIEVLKQREALAKEGYFPDTYTGGLNFKEAHNVKHGLPVEIRHMKDDTQQRKKKEPVSKTS